MEITHSERVYIDNGHAFWELKWKNESGKVVQSDKAGPFNSLALARSDLERRDKLIRTPCG